jgi:uncharacterized Rmd1/YagE family protein
MPAADDDVHALLICDRIDLRKLVTSFERAASEPLTMAVPSGGFAVLFRYGVVVLFHVSEAERNTLLEAVSSIAQQCYPQPEAESVRLVVDPEGREGISGDAILLQDLSVERLQVVADAISKSVVLGWYERQAAGNFQRIEPLAVGLRLRGYGGRRARELLRHIGDALLTEHTLIGRVEVTDKPDLVWDRPDLDRLWIRLADEFELRERQLALERKLELISRTARTALELIQANRTLRVEWYIVLLIVFEICLTLWDKFTQ